METKIEDSIYREYSDKKYEIKQSRDGKIKKCFLNKIILILSVLIGLMGTVYVSYAHTEQETLAQIQAGIAEEVLRFHVRANSDSEEDQRVKMLVKERVVSYLQPVLDQAASAEESKTLVLQHLEEVEELAEQVLEEEGCDYGVQVSVGKSDFPEKIYGDCRFPAGEYEALIVELGEGEGHNWWCMLYPGLCFFEDTYGVVSEEKKEELKYLLTEDEFSWVTDWDKVRISFKWF